MVRMSSRPILADAATRLLDTSWVLAAGIACSLGFVTAWRSLGADVVLAAFLASAALGTAFVISWVTTVSWHSRPLLIAGPGLGAASVVTLGLARLLGLSSMAVLTLLVVTAPQVRAVVVAHFVKTGRIPAADRVPPIDRAEPVRPAALELDETFVVPDVMSNEDLCQAWRSSYVALSRTTSVSSLLRVVHMRALYLDELERRAGPAALQAWFRSGARAAGDPARLLKDRDPGWATDAGPA
jgi:hypothetical protein